MKYEQIVFTCLIASVAYLGDEIVFQSRYSKYKLYRAISDNIVHAVIGFVSSLVFFWREFSHTNQSVVFHIIFCTFVSSFIDVDHIFAARSIFWKDIALVSGRGIFHCTSTCVSLALLLLVCGVTFKKLTLVVSSYMLLIAFLSHQIRDANRRGLWLYPFGHTPPLNRLTYTSLLCVLPNVLYVCYKYTKPAAYKLTNAEYVKV